MMDAGAGKSGYRCVVVGCTRWLFLVGALLSSVPAAAEIGLYAQLSKAEPYAGEPVILTLSLWSEGNLKTADLDIGLPAGATLEHLSGPETDGVEERGQRWIRSVYHYALTAFTPGMTEVGPITARVTKGDGWSRQASPPSTPWRVPGMPAASAAVAESVTVTARLEPFLVLTSRMQPWLPAQELEITGDWPSLETRPRVGEALPVRVRVAALGARGEMLPAPSELMRTGAARVYVLDSHSGSELSVSGDQLVGWREQTLSVVPQETGIMRLPMMVVQWWDAAASVPRQSHHQLSPLYVSPPQDTVALDYGESRYQQLQADQGDLHMVWYYWLPLALALSAAGGLHFSLCRRRPAGATPRRCQTLVQQGFLPLRPLSQVGRFAAAVFAALVPRHLRCRLSLGRLQREQDPRLLCRGVTRHLNLCLDLPLSTPLRRAAGEALLRYGDQPSLRSLARHCCELEQAAFDRPAGTDLAPLKQSLRRELEALPLRPPPRRPQREGDDLPRLNPCPD